MRRDRPVLNLVPEFNNYDNKLDTPVFNKRDTSSHSKSNTKLSSKYIRMNNSDYQFFNESIQTQSTEVSSKSIKSEETLLSRLRLQNESNQKIIVQLNKRMKQMQTKLSCYELSNRQLRMNIYEKTLECQYMKQQIEKYKKKVIEEEVKNRNYLKRIHQIEETKNIKEIIDKTSLEQSMIEERFKDTAGRAFKLKSFKSSMRNLQSQESSIDLPTFNIKSTSSQIDFKIEELDKLDYLDDQQKILKFKNQLIDKRIK